MTTAPPPPSQPPKIVLQVPGGARLEFALDRPVMSLGRAPENDLVVDHPSVSRHHARFLVEENQVKVQDLGSSNGTFVGGARLEVDKPVPLLPGAEWFVGQVPAQVILPALPLEAMPTIVSARPVEAPAIAKLVAAGQPVGKQERKHRVGLLAILAVGALLLLLFVVGGSLIVLRVLQQGRARDVTVCTQPQMRLLTQGGVIYSAQLAAAAAARGAPNTSGPGIISPALPAAQPGQPFPLLSTAFLELPFPYDGGNVNFGGTAEQFIRASQRNTGTGGRINSYFDHFLPLYPAPADPGSSGGLEPAEVPVGKNIVPFDGLLNPYFSYSGHPALDYSTFEYRQPTTPVFAAADGVVFSVGTHGATGALYVKIKHTVQGVGDFETIYWHLNPDEYFNAMLGTEGKVVRAGERIGTMGNTGHSTGHHLHFEVRFDKDSNGIFSASEVVDPYGYIPSVEYPVDPWFSRSQSQSNYLWIRPLGSVAQAGADGGGALPTLGGTGGLVSPEDDTAPPASVCAQPGTLPPAAQVYYSWAPDPASSTDKAGTGNGCVLSVMDADGKPVSQFNQPLTIVVPFQESDLKNIDPDTLQIYWQVAGSDTWQPLQTTLDYTQHIAVAQTDRPGKCSLMGKPTTDILPPTTRIEIAGAQAPDGSLYDGVTVKLTSSDPGGVKETHFSLDGGDTWQVYTGPFTVEPNGIPKPVVMDEESFGGGPGEFMVLAYSVDKAGNVEDPPSYDYFSIDPSKNPRAALTPSTIPTTTASPTVTPSPTVTQTPTPTFTLTPTQTPAQMTCDLTLSLTKNANCRKGPGTVYDVYTSFVSGQVLKVKGRSEGDLSANSWFQVEEPISGGSCWVSTAVGTLSGDGSCLKQVVAPPTPTPRPPTPTLLPTLTPTPVPPLDTSPPPPPRPISPVDTQFGCTGSTVLSWMEVTDPSGIDHYEWVMEQYRDGVLQGTFNGSTTVTKTNVDLPGCGYQYTWAVRAVDGAGNTGNYSPMMSFFVGSG